MGELVNRRIFSIRMDKLVNRGIIIRMEKLVNRRLFGLDELVNRWKYWLDELVNRGIIIRMDNLDVIFIFLKFFHVNFFK